MCIYKVPWQSYMKSCMKQHMIPIPRLYQIKKYLVNIIQLINKEQRTMNRSNSTACGSWGSYSFDSNLSADYPGRTIGLSHFFRDRQPLQGASWWDCAMGSPDRKELYYIDKDTQENNGTSDEELKPTWRYVTAKVKRPEQIAFLNSWNMGHQSLTL